MDDEDIAKGLLGCLLLIFIFASWGLVLWGLYEGIQWLIRH